MRRRRNIRHGLLGATAMVAGARTVPGRDHVRDGAASASHVVARDRSVAAASPLDADVNRAVEAFATAVHPLSHLSALEAALRSYFAYRSMHSAESKNPFLYFVDFGLPSTTPRGYLLDMETLTVVEGPFAVAHGRGSSTRDDVIPTRFSNAPGSAATSLGLYRADDTYEFHGTANGRGYQSIGLRLSGVSGRYNDNALARRVVAHGAPYVTDDKAGRSEGCPAMEPSRAQRLLPKLANGGMVFLFAPNAAWMTGDPWLASLAPTSEQHNRT